jgi:hypothetical protein
MNYIKILAGLVIACISAYLGNASLYIAYELFSFSTLNEVPFWGVDHSNISMLVIGCTVLLIFLFITSKTNEKMMR